MDPRMKANIEKYYPILSPHFGKTSREIAEATGLKQKHVQKLLKKYDWPRLPQAPRPGKHNPSWNGGKTVDKSGYILIRAVDHPSANTAGYVREHRLVMEKKLGRHLLPSEVVHHKNGIHDDNRPENLELFASNGAHLKEELTGKIPNWTEEGKQKILANCREQAKKRRRTSHGYFVRSDSQ